MRKINYSILFLTILTVFATSSYATAEFTEYVILQEFQGACSIAGADFDGDTDIDFVVSASDGNHIAWFENNGALNFVQHSIVHNFGNARVLCTADLDSDGDFDVVGTAYSDNKISWFENDGTGNFSEHVVIDTLGGASFVITDDIDSDNDIDILATACESNTLCWFENDGNKGFMLHIIKDDWYRSNGATSIDIDLDGDKDILGTAKAGQIIWFENDGAENFTEHVVFEGWDAPNSIQAADIDLDGDIDLAATSCSSSNSVGWFENDGNQNFIYHLLRDRYLGARSINIADIDNDEDIDVLAIAWQGSIASIFENDGNQNFTEDIFCTTAFDLLKLFIIDIDFDYDLDILGSCYGEDEIRLWENNLNNFHITADQIAGPVPLTVQFSDLSVSHPPVTCWSWDFDNDGNEDSDEQNPIWTFEQPGAYTVKLDVTTSLFVNTLVLENEIHAIGEESALYFNGENSCLTCAASPSYNLTGEFTIEAWIKPTDNGVQSGLNTGNIIDKSKILIYFIYSHPYYNKKSLCLKMKHVDGTTSRVLSTENSVKLDEWQHIAVTFNADSIVKIYFDGIEQELDIKTQPTGMVENNSDEDLIIGSSANHFSTFDGIIDEVRIWNYVRSAEEVQSEMNRSLNNDVPNLIGYWKMDEGCGETTKDEVSYENNGMLTDTQWRVGVSLSPPTSVKRGEIFKEIPEDYILYSNYPNPFNPFTTISYNLPETSLLNLSIFDVNGRLVKSLKNQTIYEAGFHSVGWDGTDNTGKKVSSGVYFYKINADTFSDTKKMLFIR